jgi:hypothetical protein
VARHSFSVMAKEVVRETEAGHIRGDISPTVTRPRRSGHRFTVSQALQSADNLEKNRVRLSALLRLPSNLCWMVSDGHSCVLGHDAQHNLWRQPLGRYQFRDVSEVINVESGALSC